MKFGTALYTLFFGRLVGSDAFGNRYYERNAMHGARSQRWVMYRGVAEPSKVPPEWHGWLHHVEGALPQDLQKPYRWQKPHQQNLTGTNGAYYPPGSILSGGKRDKATGDYQAWKP